VLKKKRSDITHPNPDVAVQLGLAMVESAVRERILFPELSERRAPLSPVTDAVFVEELARAFLGFLRVNDDRSGG
jgi:hypothetical protein